MTVLQQNNNPAVPNLPLASDAYERRYLEQFNNVLRLYFNQLNTLGTTLVNNQNTMQAEIEAIQAQIVVIQAEIDAILAPLGARVLNFPYAAIQRTTDKTFTINTATQITFDQNDYLNGCTNNGTDGIHATYAGIYNYQFSVQFANSDNNVIHTAWIWLRKNGADIAGTGSRFDVPGKHSGTNGALIAACNFYVQLAAGDTIEMWAAVDDANVFMDASTAATSPFAMPAIPSVVATLSFVSSIPT